ncbi:hypothetical protein ACL58G_04655 [Massilia sp. GER05]|jgi:hypothetical protein|nr:hypothetical protein [Telluria cellulosilytica]
MNQNDQPLSFNQEAHMAHIRIDDLRVERTLDARAMARVRGGDGAAWCFGWIQAYLPEQLRASPVINFYQINNYADQMINQFQTVSVSNSAPNSVVTVGVDERSTNNGHV